MINDFLKITFNTNLSIFDEKGSPEGKRRSTGRKKFPDMN
jgi:hypothetical protein